jgi:ATP-dependent exoDNAse (exonuclease V) alpha subunit
MLQRALADLPTIRAGTVHRIQGQEADATIFDPVNPTSPFLTDGQLAGRLVNVAASRTRQLLILVGTRAHLSRNAHLKPFVAAAKPLR